MPLPCLPIAAVHLRKLGRRLGSRVGGEIRMSLAGKLGWRVSLGSPCWLLGRMRLEARRGPKWAREHHPKPRSALEAVLQALDRCPPTGPPPLNFDVTARGAVHFQPEAFPAQPLLGGQDSVAEPGIHGRRRRDSDSGCFEVEVGPVVSAAASTARSYSQLPSNSAVIPWRRGGPRRGPFLGGLHSGQVAPSPI